MQSFPLAKQESRTAKNETWAGNTAATHTGPQCLKQLQKFRALQWQEAQGETADRGTL